MLPNNYDLEQIEKLDWIPAELIDTIKKGGWFNTKKWRVLLNFGHISGKEKSIVGPHTISVHEWKGKGGTINQENPKKKYKFWIAGTDAAGIEWTENGPLKEASPEGEEEILGGTAVLSKKLLSIPVSPAVKVATNPVDSDAPKKKGKATHYIKPRWWTKDSSAKKYKIGDPRGRIVEGFPKSPTQRQIIGRVNNYTLVRVKQIYVGDGYKYCKVEFLNEVGEKVIIPTLDGKHKGYKGIYLVETSSLVPFNKEWEPLPVVEGFESPKEGHHRSHPWPADWTKLPGNVLRQYNCYLDVKSKPPTYKTKIRPLWRRDKSKPSGLSGLVMPFTNYDDWVKNGHHGKALEVGTQLLLEYYDKSTYHIKPKKARLAEIKKLIKNKTGPYITKGPEGVHRDKRPASDLEILVCFPQPAFDAILDQAYAKDEMEASFDSSRAINFELSRFADHVRYVSELINKKASDLEHSFSKVSRGMKEASKSLKVIPGALNEFLFLNGLEYEDLKKKESTIEFGLIDPTEERKESTLKEEYGKEPEALSADGWTWAIEYVLHSYDDEAARPLTVGISQFSSTIYNIGIGDGGASALHYLYAMDSIIKNADAIKMPATEFAKKYHFPFPNMLPSNTEDESSTGKPAKTQQEELAKKFKAPAGQGKTTDQRFSEDRKLREKERKLQIRKQRERAIDFTGTNIVEDMVYLSNNVKTVDDVYIHFLNKTNLEQMAEIAISALMCSLSQEDREKIMTAKLIARAGTECIEEIHWRLKTQYPEAYAKAKNRIFEETGADAPTGTPNALKGKDGKESQVKVAKAKNALNRKTPATGAPVENSGDSITKGLPKNKKEELKASEGSGPKNDTDLTDAQRKQMLKDLLYDSQESYKLARPLLTSIIYSCIPDHEIQFVFESFLQKVDIIEEGLPDRPVKKAPTANVPLDDKKTKDPMPGVSDVIAEAIRQALAGALMAAVILMVKALKDAVDGSDCNVDFGGSAGYVDEDAAKQGFDEAGIPPDLAPDLMACLTARLTKGELQDLLQGIITDEVKAILKICAAKSCPEHLNQLPAAFENMAPLVPTNAFDENDLDIPEIASPDGLLCSDDEEPDDIIDRQAATRDRALIERIQDILEDTTALLPQLPPVMSDCGEDGMLPRDPPAIDRLNDMLLSSIFVGPKTTFRDDCAGFKDAMAVKQLKPAEKGDADWVPDIDATNGGLDPSTGQVVATNQKTVDRINQKNAKIRQRIGAKLKKDLASPHTFWTDVTDTDLTINCRAHVMPSVEQMVSEKFAVAQEKSNEIENLIDDIADLEAQKDSLPAGYGSSWALENKIKSKSDALKAAKTARDNAAKAAADIEDGDANTDPLKIQRVLQDNMKYIIPHADNKAEIKDVFQLKFQPEVSPPSNILGAAFSVKSLTPSVDLPNETSKYDIAEGEAPYQSEIFANYVAQRYIEGGNSLMLSNLPLEDWTSHAGYNALRLAHKNIFEDLLQQCARQVSFSPIFNIDYWENVSFARQAVENEGPCAPGEGEPVDLLALAKIQEDVKEEYEKSCESVDPEDDEASALENSARRGIVKTFTRLYMVEMLMKGIFVLSEFNVQTSLQDNLVLEYIMEKFKTAVINYDPNLYKDMLIDAREMVDQKIKKASTTRGEELENLFNLNNMDTLLEKSGTVTEQREAALKYLALEQFSDLADNFELAIGSRSPDVHQRFLNPPENTGKEATDNESTEAGFPVKVPTLKKAGWIRMIDVAKARVATRGDTRFIHTEGTIGETPEGLTGISGQSAPKSVMLKYPDLAKGAGSFFLERYIRVDDKDISEIPSAISKSASGSTTAIYPLIRQRVGGPEGPDEVYIERNKKNDPLIGVMVPTNNALETASPHLSGVVNLHAWKTYVDELPGALENSLKTSIYFKPLRWGIRLIYVPPMQKGAHALTDAAYKVTAGATGTTTGGWITKNNPDNWGSIMPFPNAASAWEAQKNAVLTGGTEKSGDGAIEQSLLGFFSANKETTLREKAFNLTEKVDITLLSQTEDETGEKNTIGAPIKQATSTNSYSQYKRSIVTIPLATYEEDVPFENLGDFDPEKYDSADMREKLIATEQYQYLFNYVFPLPRMISLLTIYSANSIALSVPRTETAFNKTKGALRNLYYSMSPDKEGKQWWDKPIPTTAADDHEENMNNLSSKGSSVDHVAMALRTVPILIRGMADYMDPHYKLVSRLVDYGVLPTGKTWASVPIFWPANFPFGWGPPLGGLGMAAYSMPQLSGEKPGSAGSHGVGNEWKKDPNIVDCDD